MLSRLGSVIGALFTPLKVKETDRTSGDKLNQLSKSHDQPNHKQQPKKENEKDQSHQDDPLLNSARSEKSNSQNHPSLQSEVKVAPLTTANRASQLYSKVQSDADDDQSEKSKQDELVRKNQQIAITGVWVEMKDKLVESPARSLQANEAYESGLKKKRSLLKNSKGGMVDKKAA